MKFSIQIISAVTFLVCFAFSCKEVEISDSDLGQILMVGIRGLEFDPKNPLHSDIQQYNVGGIILFDYDVPTKSRPRNITSPDQLRKLIIDFKKENSQDLLVAIDQEGGKVSRLKEVSGFNEFPSQRDIAEAMDHISAETLYTQHANMLGDLGININFAPVVDLNSNPDNPIIGSLNRSYSEDPDTVSLYSKIAINAFNSNKILPVLKHFPGHGSSDSDSHLGVVDVSKTWDASELEPYKKLIKQDLQFGVMTAHIFNTNIDSLWPATLSSKSINELLTTNLGFMGIVISDDLQMGAIRDEYDLETTIEKSLNAGVDILLFANNSVYDEAIVRKSIRIIKKLLKEERISAIDLKKKIHKVKDLKQSLND